MIEVQNTTLRCFITWLWQISHLRATFFFEEEIFALSRKVNHGVDTFSLVDLRDYEFFFIVNWRG